jgi:succinyl-CoA synthetase beta subunit
VKLYEHEAKAMLAEAGVPVPRGGLWPLDEAPAPFPLAVKTQLLAGGRGKRGGVRFAATADELETAVAALLVGSDVLPPADAVLLEERVDLERELYLAFSVDRDSSTGASLLAVREGGVDVELHAGPDALRLPLNPLAQAVPAFAVRAVAGAWGVPATAELRELLDALWRLFRDGDCVLLEVNPLGVDPAGRFVAVDARIELDGAALFRLPGAPQRHGGTAFEAGCDAAGVVATELGGHIAILTSGAGLGMATLDLVTDAGATAACVVDLGGAVFRPGGVVAEVVGLVAELRPRAILVNCLLQIASFDALASELAIGLRESGWDGPLVVRCAPGDRETAAAALGEFSPTIHDDLAEACTLVAGAGERVAG